MGLNILMSEYYLAHPWKQMELGLHPEKVDVVWPTVDSSPSLMLTGPTGRDSRSPGAGMALTKFTEGLGLGSG